MKYLKKIWIRIIVSLLVGGITFETLHILTGDPNRPRGTNLTYLYAIIAFVILTLIVKIFDKKN